MWTIADKGCIKTGIFCRPPVWMTPYSAENKRISLQLSHILKVGGYVLCCKWSPLALTNLKSYWKCCYWLHENCASCKSTWQLHLLSAQDVTSLQVLMSSQAIWFGKLEHTLQNYVTKAFAGAEIEAFLKFDFPFLYGSICTLQPWKLPVNRRST